MNIWELSKIQAKELTIKYLEDFFLLKGYKRKKTQSSYFNFDRKDKTGFDSVAIGYLESYPGSKISYSVLKRIDKVELIKDKIFEISEPEKVPNKRSLTVAFSQATVDGIFTNNFMPEMLNETDVEVSCGIVKDFMLKIGFPMLEKFNDIKELDKEINGDNFWTTDWQMPFNLGGDFDIKRIVIAWLAENPNFEEIVDKTYDIMSQNSDGTYYHYDRSDLSLRIPYTVHYLNTLR